MTAIKYGPKPGFALLVLRLSFDAPAPAAEFDATLLTTP
jgi:hypothetical protein